MTFHFPMEVNIISTISKRPLEEIIESPFNMDGQIGREKNSNSNFMKNGSHENI